MTNLSLKPIPNRQARSDWIRANTLRLLRWLAIVGQTLAILAALLLFEIDLPVLPCALLISASVAFNLLSLWLFADRTNLPESQALVSLIFDLIQLVLLLAYTGGLSNPFSLLLLAPVTISATALTRNATFIIGILAMILTSLLIPLSLDLRTLSGELLTPPDLLLWGNWIALMIGYVFLGSYARRVTVESFSMSQALAATQMALDREHKMSLLGGVVAAAAHEMGTPLATIKMISTELQDELKDRPDLLDDAELIGSQAERLSQILRDMGNTGKMDLLVRNAPVYEVVREAAEPHQNRGKTISINIETHERMPTIPRSPELVHGLRNLIQNAVDFAKAQVSVDVTWDAKTLSVLITDDGEGYPSELLSRLGEPFLRRHKKSGAARKNYEGMGLGLFIAKTLLARSGATLKFSNRDLEGRSGASVEARWPIEALRTEDIHGENPALKFS